MRTPSLGLLEAVAARGLAALPGPTQRLLSGRGVVERDGLILDPGIQLLLATMRARGAAELVSDTARDAVSERARLARDAGAVGRWPTAVGAIRELEVDGHDGQLPARHYAPGAGGASRAPLLVFLHGGGWVLGSLDSHDEPCRMLCRHAGVHVLSVGYRLAPEHPFPAGTLDAAAAFRWAAAHAEELGADPQRVAIGGDSAGGNLAAVACQQLAIADGPSPAVQVLIYPSTDMSSVSTSQELFGEGFFLTTRSRRWCEQRYLGDDQDRADPRISPLRASGFSGLPPAVVITAGFDPLRDEGEAYAAALREADVPVVLYRAESLIHGFLNFTSVNRASRDATVMIAGMIRAALCIGSVAG